jgi:P-type Cu+ transporter
MRIQRIDIPIQGMDCQECAESVRFEIASVTGVSSVDVLLSSEKAIVEADPDTLSIDSLHDAIRRAGYEPIHTSRETKQRSSTLSRQLMIGLTIAFGLILFLVVVGEALGLLERVTSIVPWPVWLVLILTGGYPIFRNVIRAALNRQIIAHTLMTVGMLAAIVVGQWATALIIVFFMRIATWVEGFTASRARQAVRDLTEMAPQTGRVVRNGEETVLPVSEIVAGDVVVVRPGDQIPVDGEVLSGQATVNQASITGESMPVERAEGDEVFAATFAQLGSLRVRASQVGSDTTFGKVIQMVEEAERHRGDTQRLADRFSSYYLPVVILIATITFVIGRDPLATAAVLVVACSCSFALATPIAVIASIGSAAKRGLVIKGGRYLESLAKADVLLVDKTGTLTFGKPQITDVIPFNDMAPKELLRIVASAEHDSEHPLAEAVRQLARQDGVPLHQPEEFEAIPGYGVWAVVEEHEVSIGNARLTGDEAVPEEVRILQESGKTILLVSIDRDLAGALAAEDTVRSEVPEAIKQVRQLGISNVTLLTGDHEAVGNGLASQLGIDYEAELLPADKIRVVREFQERGHTVVMIGDGVNDAPAIAQADVGIAMGVAGTPVAIEAAHIALMRDDWLLVPDLFRTARRTMGIVRGNLGFTVLYNLTGLSLAAFGFLPPAIAAAAQAIPDIGILGNSSRLLRGNKPAESASISDSPSKPRAATNPAGIAK